MTLDDVFRLATDAYSRGLERDSRDDWAACAAFSQVYVGMGGERNIHPFMNLAMNRLGRVQEALESCRAGLLVDPTDEHLLHNKRLYEDALGLLHGGAPN